MTMLRCNEQGIITAFPAPVRAKHGCRERAPQKSTRDRRPGTLKASMGRKKRVPNPDRFAKGAEIRTRKSANA
jgi:hypothetical protein